MKPCMSQLELVSPGCILEHMTIVLFHLLASLKSVIVKRGMSTPDKDFPRFSFLNIKFSFG